MNERIKLLAEQATSIVESPRNREGWTSSYAYFDKEKFAELIVAECMNNLYLHGYDDARTQIKQHFGVEE
jgi:hypothetical protein